MRKEISPVSVRFSACFCVLMAVFFCVSLVVTQPAFGDDNVQARQIVEKARMTLESFAGASEMEGFRSLMKDARGIFVSPQILRGAFIIGASGGSGVLLVRDRHKGDWTGPAFYTIGEASFGFQIGGDASEVILLAMTVAWCDRASFEQCQTRCRLSVSLSGLSAPVPMLLQPISAPTSSVFRRSKGLYGGISLEGAVVAVREGLNKAYYGKNVNPSDILIARLVRNDHSAGLRSMITKMAGGRN